MTELAPLSPPLLHSHSHTDIHPPTPPFAEASSHTARSRPLSEISDNSASESRRRSLARSLGGKSRPTSEVRDDGAGPSMGGSGTPRRIVSSAGSGPGGLEIKTITLNLNEYAAALKSPTGSIGNPPPPSPTTKPRPGIASRVSAGSTSSLREKEKERDRGADKEEPVEKAKKDDGEDHVSAMLVSKRASLRPSPLSASYADVTKPVPDTPAIASSITSSPSFASSSDLTLPNSKPAPKSKPSWLRRASGNNITRSKSKSPANDEGGPITASSSLPPALPPRKGLMGDAAMPPPDVPRRSSYANVAAGPSRSKLGDGQGRPAFSPGSSSTQGRAAPPPLPPRDNVGNIRNRLTAWTQAAAQSSSGFVRSESSSSIASMSTPPSTYGQSQRVPSSAQRVLGHAGSAVQKGWAGLRARGVAGSISSMSGLAPSGRRGSMEPSPSWSSGLNRRGSRDRTQSADVDLASSGGGDGPVFEDGVVLRAGTGKHGRVFGRDLKEAGRAWGVDGAGHAEEGVSDYEQRRRACLPAIVIRTLAYLEIWGPKEEGIFRISGRTSHLSRLRREFDSGADLDLTRCHPADLDPHAVSGIFKTYLRELPAPLLTNELQPKFEKYVKDKHRAKLEGKSAEFKGSEENNLADLVKQLPVAQWFLLADILRILDLISRHHLTNRMTLNALMLSLGPSLNIPGTILSELQERKSELFAKPPPIDDDGAPALIDFGDMELEPPSIPPKSDMASRSTTPLSRQSDDSYTVVPLRDKDGARKKPSLPKKPSLTRLLSVASGLSSASKQSSMDTLQGNPEARASVVDVSPPRVDVPLVQTSPLPSFGGELPPEPISKLDEAIEQLFEPPPPLDSDTRLSSSVEPPTRGPGPSTPTPIADRFASNGANFPISFRSPKSSAESSNSTTYESDKMASLRRRGGAPGFFSSSGPAVSGTHSRSHSASPGFLGTLKKPEGDVGSHDTKEDGEGRTERLSTGLGPAVELNGKTV